MAINIWRKFLLLMWKNWLIEKHHKIQFLCEILLPTIFISLLVITRNSSKPEKILEPTIYDTESLDGDLSFLRNLSGTSIDYVLAYSPKNPFTDNLLNEIAKNMKISVIGLNNSIILEEYLTNNNDIIAGIEFNENFNYSNGVYPMHLNYKLRFPSELREIKNVTILTWQTNHLYQQFEGTNNGPRGLSFPSYIHEGFIPIQNEIAMSFIKLSSSSSPRNNNNKNGKSLLKLPKIELKKFPYPSYVKDAVYPVIGGLLSTFILMGYSFMFICAVKYIAEEKEKRLKEFMKIMGLPNWLHWTSWFTKTFIIFEIASGLLILVMKIHKEDYPSLLHNSDWSVVFFILTIYGISTITFSFMLSTFFRKSYTATTISGLFWYLTYFPYYLLKDDYESLNLIQKLGCCLFSNSAMGFCIKLIIDFQITDNGLHWYSLWSTITTSNDTLCLGYIILMLIIDSILYVLITLYVEKICPGDYGIPYVWYFPFTIKFWQNEFNINNNNNKDLIMDFNRETPFEEQNIDAFESHPMYKRIGIKIKGLEKKYDDNNKFAVKELFMNMYENEITALLGHNGAGKSTIMSMLTGLISPSGGTAIINGHDIHKSIELIRTSLGLCPQTDILFTDLTIKEHLIFYCTLKGLMGKTIDIEINKYLRVLELEEKADTPTKKLSGGMKRRLSVSIALCGDPKIVLMDEPTSGMDPSVKRKLWNLLQREKIGKTILLSTHFMDEADILGDRIAILCDGQLKCYGTSFFLKKKFGTGYHLICVKAEGCNSKNVTDLLQRYIPNIKISSEIGRELSYELSDQYAGIFESMLGELEASSNKLGLSGYGISLTSLEEVFMKIGKKNSGKTIEDDNNESNIDSRINNDNDDDDDVEATTPCFDVVAHHGPLEKGFTLLKNRCKAIFMKKFIYTFRTWPLFILQIIVPIIWVIIILIGAYSYEDYITLPSLPINLDQYFDAIVILEVTRNVKKNTIEWKIGNEYTELLINTTKQNFELISINKNIQDYFLETTINDILSIKFRYVVGATIDNEKIIAWYNNEMLHTAPLTLNLIHNAIIRIVLGKSYRIDVSNHPQPFTINDIDLDDDSFLMLGFFLGLYIAFGMSFITCFYVILPIRERINGAKLLQFVAGITAPLYWLTAYLWDFITFVFILILYLTTVGVFQQGGYATCSELGRIFFVLVFFGIAAIPFTYFISKLLNEPSTAFSRIWISNVLLGPVLFTIVHIIDTIKSNHSNISWLFRIFPHYSLSEALINLSEISSRRRVCFNVCQKLTECNKEILCKISERCCNLNFLSWSHPGVIPNLLYFIVTAILLMTVILIHDLGYTNGIFKRIHNFIWKPKKPQNDDSILDDDVKNEKDKIKNFTMREISTYNVVLDRVTKFYKQILAVNEVSIAINNAECFGLLGVNGAGKTTTFKMMTGEELITSGDIYLKGSNIKNNLLDIYQDTGYCPQSDAILDNFTGRELLKIFCYIRGIPNSKIERLCIQLSKDLDFYKYLNKIIKSYSGGTKRKLNTAISLIGNPSIIFLDEPSAGMDPSARRKLWNLICRIRDTGRTIILTSHSMEECEALCTRLAIMVNGEFKCLGSTQHLKNKFSKGIILKMKLKNRHDQPSTSRGHNIIVEMINGKPCTEIGIARLQSVPEEYPMLNADVEHVLRFVGTHFWSATLSENYDGMLTFHIPLANIRWSKIFGLLENNRELLNLEDYSISQTTLEQIFLDFANQQRAE